MNKHNILNLFDTALDHSDTRSCVDLFIIMSDMNGLYSPFPRLCNYYDDTKNPIVFSVLNDLIDNKKNIVQSQMLKVRNGGVLLNFPNQYLKLGLNKKDGLGNTFIHRLCKQYQFAELYSFFSRFPEQQELLSIMNNKGYTPLMECLVSVSLNIDNYDFQFIKQLFKFSKSEVSQEIKDRFSSELITNLIDVSLFYMDSRLSKKEQISDFYKSYNPHIIGLGLVTNVSPFHIKKIMDQKLLAVL
jgi:hypothetical protein